MTDLSSNENLRLCVACRQLRPRREMVRLLQDRKRNRVLCYEPNVFDTKVFGRSVYVCPQETCVRQALKGKRLQKALKAPIPDDIVNYLNEYVKGSVSHARTQKTDS